MFAEALVYKSLAEHDSVTAEEFCNSMFSFVVYILGLRTTWYGEGISPWRSLRNSQENFKQLQELVIITCFSRELHGSEDRLVQSLAPSHFLAKKTYGECDNSSQTCLMSACMLSVNRAGCVKLETHFQLTSHSPEDAQTGWVLGAWRHTANYHGNSFLSSQLKHVWYPAPAGHRHIIRQIRAHFLG